MKDKLDPAIKEIKEVQEQRQEEERNKEFSKMCPFLDCPHRIHCLESNEFCYALHDLKKVLQNLKKMELIK